MDIKKIIQQTKKITAQIHKSFPNIAESDAREPVFKMLLELHVNTLYDDLYGDLFDDDDNLV